MSISTNMGFGNGALKRFGAVPVPVPVVAVMVLLLPVGPVGWLLSRGSEARPRPVGVTLAQVATAAGCELTEFERAVQSNPPVVGRFVERVSTRDGSYAGRRPPSVEATNHALFHGRVLFQYRRGLPERELRAFDRLTRADPEKVLLFENQTGMPVRVAATAYLSLLTCSRVDRRSVRALSAFRARRRGFGQGF